MTAHTLTISQKMAGTGTIHALASSHHDRQIHFPAGHTCAAVLAAYYVEGLTDRGYKTFDSLADAIEESDNGEYSGYSHEIIDTEGNVVY